MMAPHAECTHWISSLFLFTVRMLKCQDPRLRTGANHCLTGAVQYNNYVIAQTGPETNCRQPLTACRLFSSALEEPIMARSCNVVRYLYRTWRSSTAWSFPENDSDVSP